MSRWFSIFILLVPVVSFASGLGGPTLGGSGGGTGGSVIQCDDHTILNPADSDDHVLGKAGFDKTITDIDCIIDPADTGESISLTVRECNSTGDSCTNVEAAITCDNDGAADDGTIDAGSIQAGNWMDVLYGAPSGTVSQLTYTICYTR